MRFPAIDMCGADIAVTSAARGIGLARRRRTSPRVPTPRSATSTATRPCPARQAAFGRDDLVVSTQPGQEHERYDGGAFIPTRPGRRGPTKISVTRRSATVRW